MFKGLKNIGLLLTRIITSSTFRSVLLALLTAVLPLAVSAQESQEPMIYYYLLRNQDYYPNSDQQEYWDLADFWSGGKAPSEIDNSIFVVGNYFHLRTRDNIRNQVFGGSNRNNKLYIGYAVDLETGTVNLNSYGDDIYGVLHLKSQRSTERASVTVDDLYIGHGEVFQGSPDSTITLKGSITIQGDATLRVVAERKEEIEDRTFIIDSDIHGSGVLHIEAEKNHDQHRSEFYISSSNNDFSGDVYIESGTYIVPGSEQEQEYYHYQTHLFLTGENALYNAAYILNEGKVEVTANQEFKNYSSGVETYGEGVFTGIGSLIVDKKVEVELMYDNEETINDPVGLISINENGVLEFNLPGGMTKTMVMSEDEANYSKIESQGNIVKTGDGTLQVAAEAEGLIGAESFVISSGRLDMEGYFTGKVEVGEPLSDSDSGYTTATFSPGDVVGATANVIGDFDVNDGSTLAFEQDATGMDLLKATNVEVSPKSIFDLTMGSYQPGAEYPILIQTSGAFEDDYAENAFWNSLLSPNSKLNWVLFVNGDTVYAKIPNGSSKFPGGTAAAVPEPSTWALLILGGAGLYFIRKKKP